MLHLQLDLTDSQSSALLSLANQIPAHFIRECSKHESEAVVMREALDLLRAALLIPEPPAA
jgi:hypothetical protein